MPKFILPFKSKQRLAPDSNVNPEPNFHESSLPDRISIIDPQHFKAKLEALKLPLEDPLLRRQTAMFVDETAVERGFEPSALAQVLYEVAESGNVLVIAITEKAVDGCFLKTYSDARTRGPIPGGSQPRPYQNQGDGASGLTPIFHRGTAVIGQDGQWVQFGEKKESHTTANFGAAVGEIFNGHSVSSIVCLGSPNDTLQAWLDANSYRHTTIFEPQICFFTCNQDNAFDRVRQEAKAAAGRPFFLICCPTPFAAEELKKLYDELKQAGNYIIEDNDKWPSGCCPRGFNNYGPGTEIKLQEGQMIVTGEKFSTPTIRSVIEKLLKDRKTSGKPIFFVLELGLPKALRHWLAETGSVIIIKLESNSS